MGQTFFFVGLTVAGVVNLPRALRGMWKKPEYSTLGTDAVSQNLARPRINRYMFSLSVPMILLGVVGLIKVFGK
jgi:hypothetical protein